MSLAKGEEILKELKSSVIEFYSLTTSHFLHLDADGVTFFVFLMNIVISHINFSSIQELNNIWATILFKGGKKDPEVDHSYRTISCCPLLAKAIDKYIVKLNGNMWTEIQAETQFQGSGSSHEMAGLCVTEAARHSVHVNREPLFVLFVDSKSAFDNCLVQHIIRCLYQAGTSGETLQYLDNRLRNRRSLNGMVNH